jgi:hypothetical protein
MHEPLLNKQVAFCGKISVAEVYGEDATFVLRSRHLGVFISDFAKAIDPSFIQRQLILSVHNSKIYEA